MTKKRKIELQRIAKGIANHLKENPNAKLFYGFMPSEECDYLLNCVEEMAIYERN